MGKHEKLTAWPAATVAMKPIDWLRPFPANPRLHSERQIDEIARSIRRFGWTIPVLAGDDGDVIAGHGRILAGRKLGLTEVPVIIAAGWSEEKRREYLILDNSLAANSEWDNAMLASEIKRLGDAGANIGELGFTKDQLAEIMAALKPSPSSFLDGFTDGAAAEEAEAEALLATGGVNLSLAMMPEDRNICVAYLTKERETRGLRTIAAALVTIAREHLAGAKK